MDRISRPGGTGPALSGRELAAPARRRRLPLKGIPATIGNELAARCLAGGPEETGREPREKPRAREV